MHLNCTENELYKVGINYIIIALPITKVRSPDWGKSIVEKIMLNVIKTCTVGFEKLIGKIMYIFNYYQKTDFVQ